MPIINSRTSNNRILPTNTRSVDVAKQSLDRITGIQNKRYDNAFQVQGFEAILYAKKKGGLKCLCQTKHNATNSVLNENGEASQGAINQMLTGQGFGVLPYRAAPRAFAPILTQTNSHAAANLTAIFDDDFETSDALAGSPGQKVSGLSVGSDVSVSDGFFDNGPVSGDGTTADEMFDTVLASGFDTGFGVSSDVACPICFGTSYVGGFNVHNGFRLTLDSQSLAAPYEVNREEFVPSITASEVTFKPQVFPRGGLFLDSLKVFNGSKVIPVVSFSMDGLNLATEQSLLGYCDGLPHALTVIVSRDLDADGNPTNCTFTHVEIQYNQSAKPAKFEFPKLMQNAVESLIERTDPFQIILSPAIPNVTNGDILTDSTYGKVFQVTSSNWWNDKRRAVLGWECDVRPCQPQELYTILPKRKVGLASQNTPQRVRSDLNSSF